jgi:hypothetical protein
MYKLINKQLFEIAERNKLNYSYNSTCFKLDDKNSKLVIAFMTIGTYTIMVEINGNKKCLGRISDTMTLFLLGILRDNLNDNSFPDALKEMCHSYEKIQEIIRELKNNENSTN